MKQEISSLMDGELEPQEAERVIRACFADEDRKNDWYLYHAIGDAMRGQAPRSLARPEAVMARLKDQPTVLAPRKGLHSTVARVAMAAAASVATVGVVGWIGSQDGTPVQAPVIAKSGSAIQPVANTATLNAAPVTAPTPVLNVQDYLLAHRQVPSPDLYRPVVNRAPAAAAR